MRKILKRASFLVLILFIVTGAVIAGAHVYLSTETGARYLLSIINILIPGKIGGRTIMLSLIHQTAEIRDVTLTGPDGKLIMNAPYARVSLNLPALLVNRLVFTHIGLKNPGIDLAISENGDLNIADAFDNKSPEISGLDVYINELDARDASIALSIGGHKDIVRMRNSGVAFKASFTRRAELSLSIPSSKPAFDLSGRNIIFNDCNLRFSLVDDRIHSARISLHKGSSKLNLSGQISALSAKPYIDAVLEIDSRLEDFGKDLFLSESLSGVLAGSLAAKGALDNPSVDINLSSLSKKITVPAIDLGKNHGIIITDIDFSGKLSDRRLCLSSLKIGLATGNAELTGSLDMRGVFPGGYHDKRTYWDRLAYDVTVSGGGLRLADLIGGAGGELGGDIIVKGHGIRQENLSASISGTATINGFGYSGLKKTDLILSGSGTCRGKKVFIDPVTVIAEGSLLTARGRADLAVSEIEGTMEIQSPEINGIMKAFSMDANGAVAGKAVVSGALNRPEASLSLKGSGMSLKDITLGEVMIDAELNSTGTVRVKSCVINNRSSRITGSAIADVFMGFPKLNPFLPFIFKATLDSVNPQDFNASPKFAGAFTGRISASGGKSGLSGDIDVSADECFYKGVELGRISLDAVLNNGLLNVSSLEVEKENSILSASGKVRILKENEIAAISDPEIEMKVDRGTIFLEDFTESASGAVTARGSVGGTLSDMRGTATFDGKDLDLGVQKIKEINLKTRFEEDRVFLEPFEIFLGPEQSIRGSGWISLGGEYKVVASSSEIDLAFIDVFKNFPGLSGSAEIRFSGSGSLKNPALSCTAALNSLKYFDRDMPEGHLALELASGRISAVGSLGCDFNVLYDMRNKKYSAQAIFDSTDLTPLFAISGRPTLQGVVSGLLKADGIAGHLWDTGFVADLTGLSISEKHRVLVQADTIAGTFLSGILDLPQTNIRLAERADVTLRGSGNLDDGLVFDVKGTVPVEVISSFFKQMEDAGGNISFETHVRSKKTATRLNALFNLEYCSWLVPKIDLPVKNVNGKIIFTDGDISLNGISGIMGSGSFTLNGNASLEKYRNLRDMNARYQAKAVQLSLPDMMDITMDADAYISYSSKGPRLSADVTVIDADYYRDVNLNILTGVLEGVFPKLKYAAKKPEPLPPLLRNMPIEINIKRRGDMKVDNNLAQLYLNPDLKVTGTLSDPVVNGRISVTDGTVTFQNNTFTVTRGVIDFTNPYRTEAEIDFVSQTKVRNWNIFLSIKGPLNNLQISLSSIPLEQQSDIVSLLVMGKTVSELTKNQPGSGSSPALMAAELITSTYGSQIKRSTGLDILKMEYSSLSSPTQGSNYKFTVGKEISNRISISYEMETKNSQTTRRGIVSYKFLDDLLFNAYPGADGYYGAEFQIRHEFR